MKYVVAFCLGVISCILVSTYCSKTPVEKEESHPLCYDTKVYEAWVAHKDGEMRCFMEKKAFPHRVTASHISKDDYPLDK